ncbi:MAG: ATP-binding protein [Acidobacteria bacterium]|nr:ATP-binding protein [Acidobacteriota bacterium]
MKFKFYNLGPIKETELELHPLTVIIGPNNSGKTYIAYSLYGILKEFWDLELDKKKQEKLFSLFYKKSETEYFIKLNTASIKEISQIFVEVVQEFEKKLTLFFQDSSKKLFSKTKYSITSLDEQIRKGFERLIDFDLLSRFEEKFDYSVKEETIFFKVKYKDEVPTISSESKSEKIKQLLNEVILDYFWVLLVYYSFSIPYLLPAERNTFITTYRLLTHLRYKNLNEIDRKRFTQLNLLGNDSSFADVQNVRFPQPIEDFLESLSAVNLKPAEILDPRKEDNNKLAGDIEMHLQNSHKLDFALTKEDGRQELKVKISDDLVIDLYNASSSIKQLAPLLVYLRYIDRGNNLIIIDEPEMNLHPENQVKLLEVLGILVNSGFKILITTHSPYFMSHLNNLVNGKVGDEETLEKQARHLYLKDRRAFLKMEQVGAYEMRNNKLVSLKDPDYGIRWDTLSDVSADVQRKFFEISETGNTTKNARKRQNTPRNSKGQTKEER